MRGRQRHFTSENMKTKTQKETIPSLVSLNDVLDMGLAFVSFGLSFAFSGEEERLTGKSEERQTVLVSENWEFETGNGVRGRTLEVGSLLMVANRTANKVDDGRM